MKIRPSIILFVIIIVALIALVLWRGKKQPVEMPPIASIETNATPPATATSSAPVSAPVHTNALAPRPATNTLQTPRQSKWEQIQPILATQNDIPIVFYGRLEDQFGSPVTGAQIAASAQIYNGVRSTTERFSITSDANGFFQINHGKGESLGLMPHKAGYVLASTGTLFKYSHLENHPYVPDQYNPTVIKMWKLQGAEPLIDIGKEYKIPYASRPIYFDLVEKKVVPSGGDLKITVNRPDGIISEQHPQSWSVELKVIDGGFIETSDSEASVTFVAPEDGYGLNGTFSNNNGVAWLDENLFVKNRNGQVFCKLNLSIRINNKPNDLMYVRFSGVANTNSSRNWEATAPQ